MRKLRLLEGQCLTQCHIVSARALTLSLPRMGKSPGIPPPGMGQGSGYTPKAQRIRTPVFPMSLQRDRLHLEDREAVVKAR